MPTKMFSAALPRVGALAIAAGLLSSSLASAQRATPPPATQAGDLSALDLEQLMKLEVVYAGSKRAQLVRDVPSFVSVVTAAEIKEHGYRTLADVLKTLPSFYVSNDRNYSYVGVRGLSRPGDYSSRILMLLNGLRTNDNVFDKAYIGEEFIVDVDLIERIEVIRGPSAALYGSNAFFAVINVVTKQGRALQGAEVAATAASFGTYAGRASYGHSFANDVDVLLSASYSDSKGQRLYYPEFDKPATNNGIADQADYESFHKLLATATKGGFSFQASNVSREKGVPTASYGLIFNDTRTHSVDALTLGSLSYNRSFSNGTALSSRIHAGSWTNYGSFVTDLRIDPVRADEVGKWFGADVDARRTIARHLLTVGAEAQDNTAQNESVYEPNPYAVYTDVRNKSVRWGMFAQDEIKLFTPLTFYAGLRYDHYETFGSAMSPRVGLIYTPGTATTVKLLAGRAFRAPNAYELYYDNPVLKANPLLQPERIETLELVAQRLIGGGVQVSASAFRNHLSSLLSQRVDFSDNNRLEFVNADRIDSRGIEVGLEVNRGHGVTGNLTYTLQRTEDHATSAELSNSPRQMVKTELRAPLGIAGMTIGTDAQYLSSRRTLSGKIDPSYVVTNATLLAPRVFGKFDVSATLYNLFGAKYWDLGSAANVQDVIQQDGRSFRVKTTLHY
ncbi:MAG TPA: TonB-dependent receptor [Gemmatimonadaceae bacterium]|nr:TonB-dependent receptor [Gemmatimonadaceae bacterium]